MSGIRVVQEPNEYNFQECILANSAHLDPGDPVKLASGFLNKVAADDKVEGYYVGASITATSDNQTVAMVKGVYQPTMSGGATVFEGTADQAVVQSNIGQYCDFIISTNALTLLVSAASSTDGQVQIIDFDPNQDGTSTLARFVIAEPQELAFTQL